MFQPPQNQSNINVFTLALIGIAVGLAVYGLWLFHVEPVYTLTTAGITPITDWSNGIAEKFGPQVTEYVKQKPETLVTVGIAVTSLIAIPLIKNYFENKKVQAEFQAQQAITDNIGLSKAYANLEQEKLDLQTQLDNTQNTDFDGLIKERDKIISSQANEIKNLRGQIQGISNIANIGEVEMVAKLRQKGYEVVKKTMVK